MKQYDINKKYPAGEHVIITNTGTYNSLRGKIISHQQYLPKTGEIFCNYDYLTNEKNQIIANINHYTIISKAGKTKMFLIIKELINY